MTELAIPEPAEVVPSGALVGWAREAVAAHQLATSLSKTSFAPAHFQGKPAETTAAILAGAELGLSPIASLRAIYVVHGTPALYTRTMVALVQSRGHDVWTEKSTDDQVTVCGKRRGTEHVERSSWTLARAQRAGFTGNKQYTSNPQSMLYAKAAAEVCRKIGADVLLGVPSTVEELELDETPHEPRPVQRRQVKAEIVAPEPEDDTAELEALLAGDDE